MKLTKEQIDYLNNAKSCTNGTSLITYHISGNSNLWLVTDRLKKEYSTSQNIKSRIVRKEVRIALKTCLYILKNYKKSTCPENGLVLCSGNIIHSSSYV